MSMNKLFTFLIILLNLYHICGELFTSTYLLTGSKITAVHLVKFIDSYVNEDKPNDNKLNTDRLSKDTDQNDNTYIQNEKFIVQELKRISCTIKEQLAVESTGIKQVPPNPVSMYLFAKTISEAMSSIKEMNNQTTKHKHLQVIELLFTRTLPQKEDVLGIIMSFIRLQNTYNLTANEIAMGNILGIEVEPLSGVDCYDIGRVILQKGYAKLALQWFQISSLKVSPDDNPNMNMTQFHINLDNMIEEAKRQSHIDPDILSDTKGIEKPEFDSTLENKSLSYNDAEIYQNPERLRKYESLCSMRDTRFQGYCKYSKIQDLGFFKRPIKMEYIYDSPRIMIVHDIVDDNLNEFIRGNAMLLERSRILSDKNDGSSAIKSVSRTSSSFYLMDDMEEPLVMRFYDLLERLTGLRMNEEQSDHLQVVNYGIGGEYTPHFDWLDDKQLNPTFHTGTNRLLTIIAYLTDVEVGGSTVFPKLGVAVSPVKGSALFFTNLDNNGQGDPLTLHGGCPVFFGSKWIANKWAHTKDQDTNFLQTIPSMWT